jgi:uncharacterized membrane protein (UPF0127 family)
MGKVILLLVACLSLAVCSPGSGVSVDGKNSCRQKIVFSPSRLTLFAEKADTDAKRQRGLMGRRYLGDHEGMIFYFDHTDRHGFWMLNTLIPLAVLFISDEFVVVDVQYMEPCSSTIPEDCPVYTAKKPSRMAIEINQETARRYRIGVGDKIRFEGG